MRRVMNMCKQYACGSRVKCLKNHINFETMKNPYDKPISRNQFREFREAKKECK